MIISSKKYKKKLAIPQFIIQPSIDPLSLKNKPLTSLQYKKILSKFSVNLDKPIISQISRFDKWKDPLGVIEVFERIKKKVKNCQLLLVGNMASDDPEGPRIYEKILQKIANKKDIMVINEQNDILVNAIQRVSSIILQKSIREGFALTVSEALWKETPVVASAVGGIPLQVINGKTGFLIKNKKDAALRCVQLLQDDELRERLGKQGKEHVRKNFLITRHLYNYLCLFMFYLQKRSKLKNFINKVFVN